MKNIMKRRNKKGFTIVELVIVIGVIGILSAILIPTFVNVTKNAEAAALKANLANAYSAYTSEAADGVVDGVYNNNTGDATEIEFLSQEGVCVKFNGKFYTFNKEWVETTEAKKGTLVVEAADEANKYYKREADSYVLIANATQTTLSTFGSAEFYKLVA